jgi:hypothetical protein
VQRDKWQAAPGDGAEDERQRHRLVVRTLEVEGGEQFEDARHRGFGLRPVGEIRHGREGDAERVVEHAGRRVVSGLIEQLPVGGDRRAIDDAGERWQAQPELAILEGADERHRGRARAGFALLVQPREFGDHVGVLEQRVVAARLDDLADDLLAVPSPQLGETGGDDEATALVESPVRGDERGFDLVDGAFSLADAQLNRRPLFAWRVPPIARPLRVRGLLALGLFENLVVALFHATAFLWS